jgi:hypothetical protein
VVGEARVKEGVLEVNKSEPGLKYGMQLKHETLWDTLRGVWVVLEKEKHSTITN